MKARKNGITTFLPFDLVNLNESIFFNASPRSAFFFAMDYREYLLIIRNTISYCFELKVY